MGRRFAEKQQKVLRKAVKEIGLDLASLTSEKLEQLVRESGLTAGQIRRHFCRERGKARLVAKSTASLTTEDGNMIKLTEEDDEDEDANEELDYEAMDVDGEEESNKEVDYEVMDGKASEHMTEDVNAYELPDDELHAEAMDPGSLVEIEVVSTARGMKRNRNEISVKAKRRTIIDVTSGNKNSIRKSIPNSPYKIAKLASQVDSQGISFNTSVDDGGIDEREDALAYVAAAAAEEIQRKLYKKSKKLAEEEELMKKLSTEDFKLYKTQDEALDQLEAERETLQKGLDQLVDLDDRVRWFVEHKFDRIWR